jgi:hypothetical protein
MVIIMRKGNRPLQNLMLWLLIVVRFEVYAAVSMNNAVFRDRNAQFVPRRRHIASQLQSPTGQCCVRFVVYTAVTIKNAVFRDVTSCGACKNRSFGGTYRLHYQGEKNQRARNSVSSN